ncbi:PREDICTED: uncharacterized protein LOC105366145 [Ceratosolen solmsi marchali]|uniref:Uncharacterized protein LOC105366145 n=1 Tax=Ceratosolen solmsi marchali TaxID=326594 RepID=A0AAJ6YRD0_9HYME|nr:PREDICTED: uncharacterized protein LOC105366145 [Ceratosolen solmsi marchali]
MGLYGSEVFFGRAHILKSLTNVIPSSVPAVHDWQHLKDIPLADPQYFVPRAVDIILGADMYLKIIKPQVITDSPNVLMAELSIFWMACAGIKVVHSSENPKLTPEEQECQEYYKNNYSRTSSGRYIVCIPFTAPAVGLGDTYGTVRRILQSLVRKFSKAENYLQQYQQFMIEYKNLDHSRQAPQIPSHQVQYYLPHHGVLKLHSTTTKLRVVRHIYSFMVSLTHHNKQQHTTVYSNFTALPPN